MQGKRKSIIKKIVDVCMTVLLLCLMAYQITGEDLHEWIGIGMTAVLILHHILNRKWYAALFKGKYNAYRVVTTAVNTLLLVSISLTAVCGMSMSAHAVPFLYGLLPISFARRFHLAMSFWSFILMGLHLGLHIPIMTAGLKWNGKVKMTLAAVFAVIAGCGFWLFIKNGIPDYIFFNTPFAFFDYDKSAVLVFAENLAILTAFSFFGACCASFLRALKSDDGKNKALVYVILVLIAVIIGMALVFCTGNKQETSPSWSSPVPQTRNTGGEGPEKTGPASSNDQKPQTGSSGVDDGYVPSG